MKCARAFTLIELLVVSGILALLAMLIVPVLSQSKELGRQTSCRNNLRQLHLSLAMYANDYDGFYPVRSGNRRWPSQLQPYYGRDQVLLCPSDRNARGSSDMSLTEAADRNPRSFVQNGFSTAVMAQGPEENWRASSQSTGQGLTKDSAIPHPSATIVFGERVSSIDAFYADLHTQAGSFIEVVEQARHGARRAISGSTPNGGSNFAFADGSVRFLPFGKSVCPVNLWGVTDYYRTNFALCFF